MKKPVTRKSNQGLSPKALLLLLLTVVGTAKAQTHEFAPVGAEWYYDYANGAGQGYVHIVSVMDTVIDGVECRKLEKSRHVHDGVLNTYSSEVFGYEYVASQQDAVMLYKRGIFYTLFDLNAEVGDHWTIPQNDMMYNEGWADTVGTVVVVGKGTEELNGISLRYIEILDGEGSQCGFGYHGPGPIKVMEYVGPDNGYLFPEQNVVMDEHEGGLLRCYSDDRIGLFKTGDVACDYVTAVNEYDDDVAPYAYPNPSAHRFTVVGTSIQRVELFNTLGQVVLSEHYASADKALLEVSSLEAGVYFVRVTDEAGNKATFKFVKEKE